MSILYPFGLAADAALTATGAQAITVDDNMTIIDGVTVVATGNRTLDLTIAEDLKAGARLLIKAKTTGTETTIFGTGMIGTTIVGVAGKTKCVECVFDGTNFVEAGTPVQID